MLQISYRNRPILSVFLELLGHGRNVACLIFLHSYCRSCRELNTSSVCVSRVKLSNKIYSYKNSHGYMFWKIAVLKILQTVESRKIAWNLGEIYENKLSRAHFYKVVCKGPLTLVRYEFLHRYFLNTQSRFLRTLIFMNTSEWLWTPGKVLLS